MKTTLSQLCKTLVKDYKFKFGEEVRNPIYICSNNHVSNGFRTEPFRCNECEEKPELLEQHETIN